MITAFGALTASRFSLEHRLPLFGWWAVTVAIFLVPDRILASLLFGDSTMVFDRATRLTVTMPAVSIAMWPVILSAACWSTRGADRVRAIVAIVGAGLADLLLWMACAHVLRPWISRVATTRLLTIAFGIDPVSLATKAYFLLGRYTALRVWGAHALMRPGPFLAGNVEKDVVVPLPVATLVLPPYLVSITVMNRLMELFARARPTPPFVLFVIPAAVAWHEVATGHVPWMAALVALTIPDQIKKALLAPLPKHRVTQAVAAEQPAAVPLEPEPPRELVEVVQLMATHDDVAYDAMVAHLRRALLSPDADVRQRAVIALGAASTSEHGALVEALARSDADRNVRLAAIRTLGTLNGAGAATLEALSRDSEATIRWAAQSAAVQHSKAS